MIKRKFTVIGAGNGGKAMAAHLAIMGQDVTLYNRTFIHIEVIAQRGGIELESPPGGPLGFGEIKLVTDDIHKALKDTEIIMVVVPSSGHANIAKLVAPHLQDGQIIILHPGRTCGAIEFHQVLKKNNCQAEIILAEAETFIYASRSEGPSQARIFRIKEAVPLAALPAKDTAKVLAAIEHVYPQFIDGINVLQTGLNNMGAVFHPALTILNAGRIESTRGDFQFYVEGVTPSVAKVLETVVRGDTLYEAIQNQTGYFGINAPSTLQHRYISEDVPMSLVPIAALGERYGVSVNAINAIIRLGCILHSTDYWRKGRTLNKLGIRDLSVSELTRYVNEGEHAI
jgi:opine dehydrogenase